MRAIPSLGAIQRTNLILGGLVTLLLLEFRSQNAALSCLFGTGVVVGNLFLLAVMGRVLLAGAAGGGMSSALAAIALPLKLLLIAGLVYLVFIRAGLDGMGFGLGVLTQLVAVVFETARINLMARAGS